MGCCAERNELQLVIESNIRKFNEPCSLFSDDITKLSGNVLLLLANIALCEFMLLHRCVGYVQSAISRLEEKAAKYTSG